MAFDLLEGYKEEKDINNGLDLLEGYKPSENPSPKQRVTTPATFANKDLSGIENNPAAQREFKRNIDNLYDVPQVPMPPRNNAGYVNSNGEVRKNLPKFSESHPIISSIPEAGKQFGLRATKSFPEFGKGLNDAIALIADKAQNINPNIYNNPLYKAAKSLNPALNVAESVVRNTAPISNFAKSNSQFWDKAANKIQIDPKYQGITGLKSKETFLPTLAGETGGQATNLLMAMAGGAGAGTAAKASQLGKLGTGAATFAGTSVPNLAQEGQYLEKIEAFKQLYGRMPNADELKQIQNVALGEKAINTALESVADRLLFGKLFPEGATSKGLKDIAKSVGQQGITEGLTETAQEGVSVGAEKLLGLNQEDWQSNLARTGEAGLLGLLTGGIIGGATTAASRPYDTQFKSKQNKTLEEIAPKTVEKMRQAEAGDTLTGKVENQYTDNAKTVYNGNKYEALSPEELKEMEVEQNPEIAIDENNENVLKGHVKNASDNIVIDKNNEEVLSGHVETPEEKKIKKLAPKTAEKQAKVKQYKVIKGETYSINEDGTLQKLAPKTFKKIEQVKNAENLHTNEIAEQEGNANNEIENVAKEYSQMLGQDEVRDFHRDFAAALVNKNADKIKNLVAQGRGMNENSKKMFTKYTGIKLPSTIQGKKDVIDKWANGEITSETPTEEVTNNLIPSLKYKVSVSKDGLTADGLYMEGSNFHTDGNAAYLKEFVNADTSKVERVTKANENSEKQLKGMFNNTSQYTNKLEDIGKGIKRGKETWRVFKAGEYDNGEPRYVVINDKYLLDKKDLELYSDDENLYKPMSIRKNGKQIGLVMPIVQRNGFNTSDMVDIKPMKTTSKKAGATTTEKTSEVEKDINVPSKNENYINEVTELLSDKDNSRKVDIGAVNDRIKEVAKKENIDLEGYRHNIDKSSVNHILNRHGEGENYRNQVPITEDDIKNIPDIIYNADSIEYTGKNDKNLDTFKTIKKVDDGTIYYIEEVRTGKKTLTTDSMYKKVERSDVNNPKSLTSETTPTNNIITPKEENLNPAFPEVKKTTVTMKSGKEKEIEYVEEVPEGYTEVKDATTAPLGYTWYTNGKSLLNGERKNILVKDKNAIVEEETAQVEPKSEQVKPKESTSKKPSKKKESKKLDDAGEFLQGNRKQDTSLTWDELKDMNDLIRAKNTTKAKVYPKPTLDELEKEGFSEFQAGVILNVYNKINAKPAAGYDKIEHQKLYVDTINEVMSSIKDYIKSHPDEFSTDLIAEAAKKYQSWSYDYNQSLFDVIFPDKENKKSSKYSSVFRLYPEYNRKAIIVGGNKFTGALQLSRSTLNDVMKAVEDAKKVKETGEKVKKEPWEKNFVILEPDRWNKEYAVANKKSKQVYAKYATKEEAIAAAKRVQEKIDAFKDTKANFVRDYIERRENNKDVTTEELREAFGFRGVNFGNWTNEKERQNFVNFAYDSLYDLAELLNLPPKAMSLNGQLGLAYGAQGTGGKKAAAAHYIPEYKDINLTKEYGAGSLAHEWWHALDNYFGNQATNKEYSREWALSITNGGELRPELFKALENLQTQIKKAPFTEEDIKKNAERLTARYNRNIEYYAENIRNSYKRAKNADELLKIVDDLVENKEKYKSYPMEKLHAIENKFFKLLPENRDTLTNRGEFNWLLGTISRLNDIDELARKGANKTEYLQNAEKIDRQEGGKYWSEDTELGARAFAAYMFDKMANQNIVNRFLTRSGNGAVLNLDAFKELAEGEEKEPLTISTTPKGEERARIFKAFDKLFNTIKTRKTEKGVELYSVDLPDFIKNTSNINSGFKDIDLNPIFNAIKRKISGEELAKMLPKELGDIVMQRASKYKFSELITNGKELGVNHWKRAAIELNLKAIGNNPKKFVNALMHEVKHAEQYKLYLDIMGKPRNKWTFEERSFVAKYNICSRVNTIRDKFYKKHRVLCDRFEKNNFYSAEERSAAISKLSKKEQDIIDQNDKNLLEYLKADFEAEARAEGIKYDKDYRTESKYGSGTFGTLSSNNGTPRKWNLGTNSRDSFAAVEPSRYKQRGEVNTSDEINQVVRDKVYEWHGNLESDRYDVDKSLNSFIQLTKHKAAEVSKKLGMKVSDKQIREIMPFLRERTGFPKSLDREDLRTLFDKLSGADKAELAKLADTVSDKFEKYYTNYKEAKGEQTSESIENHISHIWDLDKKKKGLLTNYITTNSKFAKQRTIGTFVEGIDGIEINGEKVQFKPKTLDYAEILKSSSDNLIKATHDSNLANAIKSLEHNGEKLVQPASKAPDEWIEVNHPALNKAVYQGAVGEDEIPMLMKTPVKVHPEIADYVSAIFEVQKPSEFWRTFDALNGMIKQGLLGFSGFHGYALSESAVGNAGVGKTLKELNPKKFVDAIKNGNYDVYKNEEAAKRAINAGVQLGTPSDLQRNLVEETLKKVPFVGKYLAGAVGANNKILWDVLHNNFKVMAFNTAIDNLGGNVTKEQERAIAQWVNDSFGGQAWELLGIKKSAIKAASRVLLSPDWNFSTIRQAAAGINSDWLNGKLGQNQTAKRIGKLTGIGEEAGSQGARGKIGRGFWLRSALYFTVFYNLLNAAFRERDRKEHPELYPNEMTPYDYSIWANSYPMDNIYDRIMPKVFIGRNSDGTARMLRVGKQFREVPEFVFEPVSKLGGKTSPLISIASQVGLGMSPSDVVKKATGGEAFLNQDMWEGYGEDAKMREGMDLAKGRVKALGKSLTPFIASKYIGGKHEFSWWDFFAQTNAGGSKSKVYKQTKEALNSGNEDKIKFIKRRAYQDGLSIADINKMVGYAKKDYQAGNTRRYKKNLSDAMANRDKNAVQKIRKDMAKRHLSEEEQRRIRDKAWEDYINNNKT